MKRLLKKYIKALKNVEKIEKKFKEKYDIEIITGHERVQIFENIEKLSFFAGYELNQKDRDDKYFNIEKSFSVDGYTFFGICNKEEK